MTVPGNLISSILATKLLAATNNISHIGNQVMQAAANGTATLLHPTGTQVGDLVMVEAWAATSGAPVVAGYAMVGSSYLWPSYGYTQRTYYKLITSLDAIQVTGLGQYGAAYVSVYRGATGIGAFASHSETTSTGVPSLTTTGNNSTVVASIVDRAAGQILTGVAGWRYRGYKQSAYSSYSTSDLVYATAGSITGPVIIPKSAGDFVAVGRLIELI